MAALCNVHVIPNGTPFCMFQLPASDQTLPLAKLQKIILNICGRFNCIRNKIVQRPWSCFYIDSSRPSRIQPSKLVIYEDDYDVATRVFPFSSYPGDAVSPMCKPRIPQHGSSRVGSFGVGYVERSGERCKAAFEGRQNGQ